VRDDRMVAGFAFDGLEAAKLDRTACATPLPF
jgi:hypothetical protein